MTKFFLVLASLFLFTFSMETIYSASSRSITTENLEKNREVLNTELSGGTLSLSARAK